jgi:hypothetical protein
VSDRGPTPEAIASGLASDPRRLQRVLSHRRLEIDLEEALEQRIHAYAAGLNARLAGDGDPYDTRRDEGLAEVIILLCESALERAEQSAA